MKDLIILHGALGSDLGMQPLANQLSRHFTIHNLSFSGHGGKAFEKDFSITQFVHELDEYIVQQKLHDVIIFGYSLGGYVALLSAEKNKSISQIITLGTKMDWSEVSLNEMLKMFDADQIELKVPKLANALEKIHAPNNWKELVEKTALMITDLSKNHQLNPEMLNQITIPIKILLGADDKVVSLEESQWVSNLLSSSQLEIIEGFAHEIHRCDPEVLATKIVNSIT